MRPPCSALDFRPPRPWEINTCGLSCWTNKSLGKQSDRGPDGHRKAGREEPRVGPGQTWRPARALPSRGAVGSGRLGRPSSRRKMQRSALLHTTQHSSSAWLCPCHTWDSPLWGRLSAAAPWMCGAHSLSWGVLCAVGCLQQP